MGGCLEWFLSYPRNTAILKLLAHFYTYSSFPLSGRRLQLFAQHQESWWHRCACFQQESGWHPNQSVSDRTDTTQDSRQQAQPHCVCRGHKTTAWRQVSHAFFLVSYNTEFYIDVGYLGNSAYNQLCFITRDRVSGLLKWVIIGSGNGLLLVRHSVKHFNNIWIKLQNSLRNAFENVMAKRQLLWWPNARLVTPLLTHWSYLELLFTKRLPRFSALVLESCSIQFGLLFRIPVGFG